MSRILPFPSSIPEIRDVPAPNVRTHPMSVHKICFRGAYVSLRTLAGASAPAVQQHAAASVQALCSLDDVIRSSYCLASNDWMTVIN